MSAAGQEHPGVRLLDEGEPASLRRVERAGRSYQVQTVTLPDAGETERARLRSLLCTLARVGTPSFPQIRSISPTQSGFEISIDCPRGASLAERLERSPLSEDEALALAQDLGAALVQLHDFGVSYGEISERRVALSEEGTWMFSDYGLAFDRTGRESYSAPAAGPNESDAVRREIADLSLLGALLGRAVGIQELASRSAWARGAEGYPRLVPLIERIVQRRPADGITSAPELCRLLSLHGDPRARISGRHRIRTSSPLRENELAVLCQAYATRSGVSAVVVRGAAGSGKSHLLASFAAEVAAGRVLVAACRHWELAPFGALRQLFERLVFDQGRVDAERLSSLLCDAGDLARLLRPLSPRLAAHIPEGAGVPKTEPVEDIFIEGLAELVVRVLRRDAQVLLVEDVQWLDESSGKVLRRVVERADTGTFFCFSLRDDAQSGIATSRLFTSFQHQIALDLRLEPLATEQSARVVAEHLSALRLAPAHARALALLADGTPFGATEVVKCVLELGMLSPHWDSWQLDVARVARLSLPGRTLDLMARRLGGLAPETLGPLRMAAVLSDPFDARVLRAACAQSAKRVAHALHDAGRVGLIERAEADSYRFVHQNVRDALLAAVGKGELGQLHARAARGLTELYGREPGALASDLIYQVAHHSARAGAEVEPELAFEFNAHAGQRAFAAFDNARALSFLTYADALADEQQRRRHKLGLRIAECRLRTGELAASLAAFQAELDSGQEALERAHVLSRIAWIHEAEFDSELAWQCLVQAFAALGEPAPGLRGSTLVAFSRLWISAPRVEEPKPRSSDARRHDELALDLYFQSGRLAVVSSQVGRLVDATLRGVRAAERLGPSAALSRAYLMWAFMLTMLGRREASRRLSARMLEVTEQVDDPVALAHYYYAQMALVAWQGDMRRALELGALTMSRHQSWMTASDLSLAACNQDLLETVRGHNRQGWAWLESAAGRALRCEGAPLVSELLVERARASALHLGTDQRHAALLRDLQAASRPLPRSSAFYTWGYACRLRLFSEVFDHGPGFEALVSEFEALGQDPRRVHLGVTEYYVTLAHARVDACYSLGVNGRSRELRALERAVRDLRACARVAILKAHAIVVDAARRFFKGDTAGALRRFEEAERLGRQEDSPWVLYAVFRGRAHCLRQQGDEAGALAQAELAVRISEEHGSVHRVRRVQSEFARGAAGTPAEAPPEDTARSRRQLRALLAINRASSLELAPEQQARIALDEMIAALGAERGVLLVRDSSDVWRRSALLPSDLRVLAARDVSHRDLTEREPLDPELLARVLEARDVSIVGTRAEEAAPRAMMLAPLIVHDTTIGVVVLEAAPESTAFTPEDGEVLRALASQIPVSLELAQALRDRGRLEEDLRQSQKMEAVGLLAGGIAHDFNNMLTAICTSVESALAQPPGSPTDRGDLETIQYAADRATKLTRQLLAFSRRQVFSARVLDLNQTVRDVIPMLERLLEESVSIVPELQPVLHAVKADESQLEQVLLNLAVNARDAMPRGGRLRISTSNHVLDSDVKPKLAAGDYVMLSVSDEGIGMDVDTQRRVFEPFFTTKQAGAGTGLGLAMVYGIVQQSGGYIEVESELGRGTTFRILLPRSHDAIEAKPRPLSPSPHRAFGRLLLVDDEPLVRHAMGRALSLRGFEVRMAAGGPEALTLLREDPRVDLIISDVIMPQMNGIELAAEIARLGIGARVLYVSGHADGVLPGRTTGDAPIEFLQKPVSAEHLTAKVQQLLNLSQQG